MRIRHYQDDDDPALMALERLCPRGLPEPFVHYRQRFIDRAALFADHELLVAVQDDAIVGVAAVIVKQTCVGGVPVKLGYVFDVRTNPAHRRQGIGYALVGAVDDYLRERGVDGAYAHIVSSNVASLKLFAKLGYTRLRQVMLLTYQPYPSFEAPDWMPRHLDDHTTDRDRVATQHGPRDLFVGDVAANVKDFGFERWSLDLGDGRHAGMSVFDQSHVFQQWPADKPFPNPDEMQTRGNKSLRLFDEVGIEHPQLLLTIFNMLRDLAVSDNVSKLTLLVDRMDRIPTFLYAEAVRQMDYWMVFKSLNPAWQPNWQDRPIYMDAREL